VCPRGGTVHRSQLLADATIRGASPLQLSVGFQDAVHPYPGFLLRLSDRRIVVSVVYSGGFGPTDYAVFSAITTVKIIPNSDWNEFKRSLVVAERRDLQTSELGWLRCVLCSQLRKLSSYCCGNRENKSESPSKHTYLLANAIIIPRVNV
jgi:hypothetical protein